MSEMREGRHILTCVVKFDADSKRVRERERDEIGPSWREGC